MARISLVTLLAVIWLALAVPPHANADGGCSSEYVGVPPGPLAPVNLQAVGSELRWVNLAGDANCLVIEIKPYLPPALATQIPEQWLPFATIYTPQATSYAVPAMESAGQVCFRMYAANAFGRSDYTNAVCLLAQRPPTFTPTPTPTPTLVYGIGATLEKTPVTSTESLPVLPAQERRGRPVVGIVVGALLAAVVVGLLLLRWQVRT